MKLIINMKPRSVKTKISFNIRDKKFTKEVVEEVKSQADDYESRSDYDLEDKDDDRGSIPT